MTPPTREELVREYIANEAERITCCDMCLKDWNEKTGKHAEKAYLAGFARAVEMLKSPECSEENEAGFTSAWNLAVWLEEQQSKERGE